MGYNSKTIYSTAFYQATVFTLLFIGKVNRIEILANME